MINAPKLDELSADDEGRRNRMKMAMSILEHNTWFEYKRASEIFDEFDIAYLQACRYFEEPGSHSDIRPVSLFLTGEVNTGKTTLVVKYMNYCRLMATREGRVLVDDEILYFETPVDVTLKRMFAALLDALDIEIPENIVRRTHADTLITSVIKELRKRKVKMLFIDEIQNLVNTAHSEKEDIFDGFKKLANQSQTRLVLIGTPPAMELFMGAKWIDERYRMLYLPRWEISKEYLDLLKSIRDAYGELLPEWDIVQEDGMINREIATRIHEICDGRLGKIIQTIQQAAVRALIHGHSTIPKEEYLAVQPIRYFIKNGKIAVEMRS